ncbi:glycosyltransferase [Candidatus Peregrinibacteria bacterium]|nr:glycosyltransferase [Candidatus Peregrinibacteria bacterium]MBI3816647.1 glycosyltransferase [Candidatus Peregrinibacteria bacterium]
MNNDHLRKILAFGYHDQASPRHRSVCAQLEREGCAIFECHTNASGFLPKYRDLLRQWKQQKNGTDAMLVPFPGHFLMPLAWLLTRSPRKRLLFDAFLSLHDTNVTDRKIVPPWNPYAWLLFLVDWISCRIADEVFIDTQAHRQFFLTRFHLKPGRIRVIYLETRADLFTPKNHNIRNSQLVIRNSFEVFFYGTHIPLQGVDHILDAAKILQDRNAPVHFTLVGSKKLPALVEHAGLKNVSAHAFVPLEELPAMIHGADLCLGIFGTTAKAKRVIPHKVIDAVACGVPVLTEDSPAIRERFADHPLVRLCPAGEPGSIVEAIERACTLEQVLSQKKTNSHDTSDQTIHKETRFESSNVS